MANGRRRDTVAGCIPRGYLMMKRGFDSMVLGNLFTHDST